MFKKYSQKGCIFECSLNYAIKHVGCLPWDFPIPTKWNGSDLAVCHSFTIHNLHNENNSLEQFYEAINSEANLKACGYRCMPDCEATIYETQERDE